VPLFYLAAAFFTVVNILYILCHAALDKALRGSGRPGVKKFTIHAVDSSLSVCKSAVYNMLNLQLTRQGCFTMPVRARKLLEMAVRYVMIFTVIIGKK